MIIPCFRCRKLIYTPNGTNADYVIADDMIAREPREVLIALRHNEDTRRKEAMMKEIEPVYDPESHEVTGERLKYPDLTIDDSEYDRTEVSSIKEANENIGTDLVKVSAEVREKDIQKTGIVCPDCYRPTDFLIWGIHKEGE